MDKKREEKETDKKEEKNKKEWRDKKEEKEADKNKKEERKRKWMYTLGLFMAIVGVGVISSAIYFKCVKEIPDYSYNIFTSCVAQPYFWVFMVLGLIIGIAGSCILYMKPKKISVQQKP